MSDYCYYYARALKIEATDSPTVHKFLRGNPKLLGLPEDFWQTFGKYKLHSRPLTGGLSGTGDVHHPAKHIFKVTQYLIFFHSFITKNFRHELFVKTKIYVFNCSNNFLVPYYREFINHRLCLYTISRA